MSIVLPAPRAEAPLSQGDMLKDVPLYIVGEDEAPEPIVDAEEEAFRCLVLSRNCQAFRSETIVVAAIRPYRAEQLKALAGDEHVDSSGRTQRRPFTMDELRRRLDAIRDGRSNPDQFYLGDFDGNLIVRYAACLDSLHTLSVPTEPSVRREWVEKRRVGTLSADHRRHLHAAIFNATAPEGFDDYQWWADADLVLMIAAGRNELAEAEKERTAAATEVSLSDAKQARGPQVQGQARRLVPETLEKVKEKVGAYEAEWERRHPGTDPLDLLGKATWRGHQDSEGARKGNKKT